MSQTHPSVNLSRTALGGRIWVRRALVWWLQSDLRPPSGSSTRLGYLLGGVLVLRIRLVHVRGAVRLTTVRR